MNTNIFKIMVKLQHELNIQTAGADYLDKSLGWNSAIIAESGELLESLGYKWWKKQVPDMDNVKVETIDLLHFVISEHIQFCYINNQKDLDLSFTIAEFSDYFREVDVYDNFDETNIGKLIDLLNYDNYDRFFIMKQIFKALNMTNEDVYIAYIVKNCLNKFRQDFGYKDGTYIKEWQGREDNIVAYELANKIGATENLFDRLYSDLRKVYVGYVAFAKNK